MDMLDSINLYPEGGNCHCRHLGLHWTEVWSWGRMNLGMELSGHPFHLDFLLLKAINQKRFCAFWMYIKIALEDSKMEKKNTINLQKVKPNTLTELHSSWMCGDAEIWGAFC